MIFWACSLLTGRQRNQPGGSPRAPPREQPVCLGVRPWRQPRGQAPSVKGLEGDRTMSFFSRLSDIVSCKLEDLIAEQEDPPAAMLRIVSEIEEGLAGAKRSVTAAGASEERLRAELQERLKQAAWWSSKAREELAADREDAARQAL